MAFAEVFADMGWSVCVLSLPAELAVHTCQFGVNLLWQRQPLDSPVGAGESHVQLFPGKSRFQLSHPYVPKSNSTCQTRGMILGMGTIIMAVEMAWLEGWP